MNTMDAYTKSGMTLKEFTDFLKELQVPMTPGRRGGMDFDDSYLQLINEAIAAAKEKEALFHEAATGMLITSGFTFDGYKITKYSGYISGDDAIQIDRDNLAKATGPNSTFLTDALVQIRRTALQELKKAAYDLGCNAVIGVDFDYMTFEPETISGTTHYYMPYVVCVTANGNAVVIEKDE